MNVKAIPISKVTQDPANVRSHDERNLEAIKGSLARFGQQKPIVISSDNVVIAGNGTLTAARELGWTTIDTVKTSLTGTEITAYAIADNRTAELASWDNESLLAILKSIDESEVDLAATGFDELDLQALASDWDIQSTGAPNEDYDEEKEFYVVKIESVLGKDKEALVEAFNTVIEEMGLKYAAKAY